MVRTVRSRLGLWGRTAGAAVVDPSTYRSEVVALTLLLPVMPTRARGSRVATATSASRFSRITAMVMSITTETTIERSWKRMAPNSTLPSPGRPMVPSMISTATITIPRFEAR